MFASENYLYDISWHLFDKTLHLKQYSWGSYWTEGAVVITSLGANPAGAVALVVPDNDPSTLHFVQGSGSGVRDVRPSVSLAAAGPFTTATAETGAAGIYLSNVFMASSKTVVRICFEVLMPGQINGQSAIDLTQQFK